MPENMYCKSCLYDLRHLKDNACPECGRTFAPDDATTFYINNHHPKRPLHFLFGGAFVLLFLFWPLIMGGRIGIFIDTPSLVLVLGLTFSGLWMSFGIPRTLKAITSVFLGKRIDAPNMLATYVLILERGRILAWTTSTIGAIVGLISMLSDLPDPSSIGAGMAVALICQLYGAILGEFFFAQCSKFLIARANLPLASMPKVTKESRAPIMFSILFILLAVADFSVLMMVFP
ncbi:MotA/TolQ/ExbB proton channel family protein [Poriferisphaera sp. WC338]|uniref:MotA/TolQ/ExbB proton channel family protein n=1 Tax=Poriferisphaera sp. WC338 TaxID=3425129 RepID=UPI003D815876